MAGKKKRGELISALNGKTGRLEEANNEETPNARSLKQKLRELQEAMTNFEVFHYKQVSEEEDLATQTEMKAEFSELMKTADVQQYAAEDALENLEAADTPPERTPEQDKALIAARIEQSKEALDRRAAFIQEGVTLLENPSKNLVNTHLDVIATFRHELEQTLEAAYAPLYKLNHLPEYALDLDSQKNLYLTTINKKLDTVERAAINKTPAEVIVRPGTASESTAGTTASATTGPAAAVSQMNAYKTYQRPHMPKFNGEFRFYPKWKEEFEEQILPCFDEKK